MNEMNGFAVLKHVRSLLALDRHGSINRAAEALGITQSAMTKALQRAEAELGQTLFLRHAKGVEPTPAGLAFIRSAKVIHAQSVDALNDLEGLGNAPGVINVGAAASFIDDLLPRAMANVVNQFPSIEIRLTEESVEGLMMKLRDAELDVLFISEPPGVAVMKDIRWTPLLKDEMNIVARLDHPLAKKRSPRISELKPFGWVLGRKNDPQRSYIESVYRANGMMPPNVTVESVSRNLAVRIVQFSDLLTLVPNAESNDVYRNLHCIDCRELRWLRTAGIAAREGVKLPVGVNILIREVKRISRLDAG